MINACILRINNKQANNNHFQRLNAYTESKIKRNKEQKRCGNTEPTFSR